jgi:hypothetical protein
MKKPILRTLILLRNRLCKELNLNIQLYNICGQTVYSENIFNINNELYIPLGDKLNITNGIYILRLSEIYEGTTVVKKVIQ